MPAKSSCETVYYYTGAVIDNRYVLQEFLGEGGMACVYRARELHAPHPYAIKFLKSNFSNNTELLEHFGREAQNMKNLAHPNIVRFYDFVHHADYAYIVMDYIDGFSLSAVLKKLRQREEQLPLNEAVRILTQVARGIDKIHRANFIHRDIKPGNILIAKQDGTAYVADLGIMVDLRDETLLSLAAGTRAYMPPEQQIGERVDRTADIYAFGIVAFELFAGQRPFTANKELKREEAENDLIRQHFESPIPSMSLFRNDLPPALDAVLAKALAKKAADRYEDVLEFARDIHRVLAPRLAEDLQDFSEIRAIKPQEIYYVEPTITTAPPSQRSLASFILGLIVLSLGLGILSWVVWSATNTTSLNATAAAIAVLLQTPSATVTASPTETSTATASATETSTTTPTDTPTLTPTDTPTATATDTPTLTPTDTPSVTPTFTPTASVTATSTATPTETATPEPSSTWTPVPVATTSIDGASLLPLVSGQSALGFDQNASLALVPDSNRPLTRLNVGIVNGFRVSATFSDVTEQTRRYGIAYRIQDNRNYLLFTINPDMHRWQLEQVINAQPTVLDSGGTAVDGLETIIVSGENDFFRIEVGSMPVEHFSDTWSTGGVGLWLEGRETIVLDAVSFNLLGADALTPLNALRTNAVAMLATGDVVNNTINCPAYIPLYTGLSSYATIPSLSQKAQQFISTGQLVYQRCQSESPEASLSFAGSLRDFLNWKNGLSQLISELQSGG